MGQHITKERKYHDPQKNILAILVNLLADQECVTITYEIKNGGTKNA